jgi:hypothetical protein
VALTLQDPVASGTVRNWLGGPTGPVLTWGATGLGIGWGQWYLLRRHGAAARWWIPLGVLGCLAGWSIAWALPGAATPLPGALLAGGLASLPVWALTRRAFRHARWLLVAGPIAAALFVLTPWIYGAAGVPDPVVPVALSTLAMGVLPGLALAYGS